LIRYRTWYDLLTDASKKKTKKITGRCKLKRRLKKFVSIFVLYGSLRRLCYFEVEFIQKIASGINELVHSHTLLVTELGEFGKNESTNYQKKILL
jgi:hypothetical protein